MHVHTVYLCCTREMQAPVCNTGRGAERKLGDGTLKKGRRREEGIGVEHPRGIGDVKKREREGGAWLERLESGGGCPLTDELGRCPTV